MKKLHRFLALAGVILLILLYLSTLIFAFMDSELASDLLMASVAATIIVPVILYGFTLFIKLSKNGSNENSQE